MDLDRGTLARLDCRLLAGLGRDERFQIARVPVTKAKWSTWKRYCDSAGMSMGRAIAVLIEHELAGALGEAVGGVGPVFIRPAEERIAEREAKLASVIAATELRIRRLGIRVPPSVLRKPLRRGLSSRR
jgi:hypothetical protein